MQGSDTGHLTWVADFLVDYRDHYQLVSGRLDVKDPLHALVSLDVHLPDLTNLSNLRCEEIQFR